VIQNISFPSQRPGKFLMRKMFTYFGFGRPIGQMGNLSKGHTCQTKTAKGQPGT